MAPTEKQDSRETGVLEPQPNHTVSSQADISKKRMVLTLITVIILLLGVIFYLLYQDTKQNLSTNTPPPTPTMTTSPTSTPTVEPTQLTVQSFKYGSFSFKYPNDWEFMDKRTEEDFPLRNRLFDASEATIALVKNGTYLIIDIDENSDQSAQGIFINEEDYSSYIANKDVLLIEDATYYLDKDHDSIPDIQNAHVGPFTSLAEFIPQYQTPTGTYKGYAEFIKKDEDSYIFLITSNSGGVTDRQLQEEIIAILESITW